MLSSHQLPITLLSQPSIMVQIKRSRLLKTNYLTCRLIPSRVITDLDHLQTGEL